MVQVANLVRGKNARLERISSLRHSGASYGADCWAVLDLGTGVGKELCFINQMVKCSVGFTSRTYMQVCRFTFVQLGVETKANELWVALSRLQGLLTQAASLESAAHANMIDIYPSRCNVTGRWLWHLVDFEEWATGKDVLFRAITLVGTIRDQIRFVYR